MNKIIILFLLYVLSFSGYAFAEEYITIDESKWGNQTITNVYVTTPQRITHTNGDVMMTSATLLGFVGLGSMVSATQIPKRSILEVFFFILAFVSIGMFIIVQLSVINDAFTDEITTERFTWYIQITVVLVVFIISFILGQLGSSIRYTEVEHKELNARQIMESYITPTN